MKRKITNEMLAKYFSGNCSDLEKQEVEHWKEISEDNSRVFEEMKALWRNAFITNTYNPDPEASLHKVNSKLGFLNKEKAPDSKVIGFHILRFALRAAAALLIICAGYWFFHLYTETTKHQVLYSVSAIDEKKIVILPDSSVSEDNPALPYLWAPNKIKYPDDYTKFYSGDDTYWQQNNMEIIGIKKEVTAPGLKNNLLTQNTSFIAVDSIIRNKSHEIVKVKQPLPLPEGVSNLAVAENNMKSGLEDVVVTASKIGDDGFIPVRDRATADTRMELKGMESVMGTSVEDMLQGRLGNVDIAAVSGDPVAGLNIRIRGTASLNANNNPLIVVNGIPYNATIDNDFDFDSADIEKFGQLIDVSPEDIETIEVLKDSASTAIWGSRAANRVIDIKTKRYMKSVMEDVVVTASKIGNDGFSPVRDRATAVARMELKGMESVMGTTVEDMLQGRMGNVDIAAVSGDPGAGLNIRIRGTSSLNSKNYPLIVVNGIPYSPYYPDIENFDFATADVQEFAKLIDVSPKKIESIEFLNDTATISKYGPAATYGVINIKTKRGKTKIMKRLKSKEQN